MELRHLKTFKTVASTLNFRQSAEILHYAQSTISFQIKALEEYLGSTLFDRLGKKVRLTIAGEKLLRYADRLLDLEAETISEVSNEKESQATLSIRIPQTLGTYYLPEILCRFIKTYPKVGFDISTCAYHSLQRELKTGTVDLALLFAEDLYAPEIKAEILGLEKISLVVNKKHVLLEEKQVSIEALKHQTLLLPKHDCAYKMDLERILAEKQIHPVNIMTFNSVETIKQCIARNIGIALIPEITIRKEIEQGKMVGIDNIIPSPEVNILMLTHRGKWLSPILKQFIKEVRFVFQQKK